MTRGEAWFAALFAAHHPDIVRYARRRGIGAAMARELADEVFVVAWRRRQEVPDAGLPWLYGVARIVLANSRRQLVAAESGAWDQLVQGVQR